MKYYGIETSPTIAFNKISNHSLQQMLQQGAFKLLHVNFMQRQIVNNFSYINGQAYRKVLTHL